MINTHLKVFDTEANYEAGKLNLDMPNVSYCEDTEKLKYLNSMADLYDIFGTCQTDQQHYQSKIKINGTNYSPSFSDGHFGFNWNGGTVSSLSFTDSFAVSGGNNKYLTIDKIGLDTSAFTSMAGMFSSCSELKSVNVSNFITTSVTDMHEMFISCAKLTSLDVNNFNTSAVTTMSAMFFGCNHITSLNLNNFDTSSVTNMDYMFKGCSGLISLDLSNWDTSSVSSSTQMFKQASVGGNAMLTITMNNTNTTTFDMIKAQLVTDGISRYVTIIRDGVTYKYQNNQWVAQ